MKTILIISILFLSFSVTSAQMRRGNQDSRTPFERIEELKKIKMMEALNLSEEQSIKVIARYNKHREAMKAIEQDRSAVLDKLEEQLKANTSDADFEKSFSALGEIETRMRDARKAFFESLKEVLNTKQVAEYFVFERNFARDIRNMAKDFQRRRLRN